MLSSINLKYFNGFNNFGDILNSYVVEKFFKKKVINLGKINKENKLNYIFNGSIIDWSDQNSNIWGAGAISSNTIIKYPPKKIFAVRGVLTRELLLKQNIECNEVYGDLSYLLPYIYNPSIKQIYKIGILPHYIDYNNELLLKFKDMDEVKIINVSSGVINVINDICSCKKIISSSLHGLIASDVYQIPNKWVNFSNRIIGGEFKFKDYYSSTNINYAEKFNLTNNLNLTDLLNLNFNVATNKSFNNFINNCPLSLN